MTVAICIACGARKLGALVPCRQCAYAPVSLIDQAKSVMLSEHNFRPEDLRKFSLMIKSGEEIPYEPIALVICGEPIA